MANSQKHPFKQFKFCPKCGSGDFRVNNDKSKICPACGFIYYFNSSAAVACFIRNENQELLVVRRANEPAKGTLDLPGGFCDSYETAEQTVAREILEETGLSVKNTRYLFSLPNIYLYSGFEVHTVDMCFECRIKSFEGSAAADDAAELITIKISELDPFQFGLESIRKAVGIYKKNNDY